MNEYDKICWDWGFNKEMLSEATIPLNNARTFQGAIQDILHHYKLAVRYDAYIFKIDRKTGNIVKLIPMNEALRIFKLNQL
jgi:hypothetical protein